MADGIFASKVSATRDANTATNPIFVNLTDGTAVIGTTGNALDVNIASGSVTVTATDLDIRDLSQATDSVAIGDGTDTIAIAADGSIAVTDNGTTLSIDDGAGSITVDGTVAATQSGTWNIGTVTTITNDVNIADGGNSITVDATNLDIRDLTDASDKVAIGDGTDTLGINSDGSINVNIVSAVSADEFQDYNTATPAGDGTSNLDYTVSNTTGLLTSVIMSSSGDAKFEIQAGPVASLVTKAVVFLTGKEGDTKQIFFDPALEATGTTPTFRAIATNRESVANDVYVTFVGRDI